MTNLNRVLDSTDSKIAKNHAMAQPGMTTTEDIPDFLPWVLIMEALKTERYFSVKKTSNTKDEN